MKFAFTEAEEDSGKSLVHFLARALFYTFGSKCHMTVFWALFSDPFTTHICSYVLMLPRFFSCLLVQLQKFVHVAYFPACALVLIRCKAN